MRDALKSYMALAGGITEVTRNKALEVSQTLVAQGLTAAGQVSSLAEDVLTQGKQNREAVSSLVKFEVDRAMGRIGLAAAEEVASLTARVRALEAALRAQNAQGPSAAATDPAAGATPAAGAAKVQPGNGAAPAPRARRATAAAGKPSAAAARTAAETAAAKPTP